MMENVVHIKNAVLAALAALGTFVANALGAVSYTHLTLPTICSV